TRFAEDNDYAYGGALVRNLFGPILLLVALNSSSRARTTFWRVVIVVLLGTLGLACITTLEKAHIALLCLLVIVNRVAWRSRAGLSIKRLAPTLVLILIAVVVLGYYVTYEFDVENALLQTLNRSTVIPLLCVNAFLYVYPDIVDYNYGLGVGLVARVLGVTNYVSPPVLVVELTASPNCCANAFWATEMWSAFGIFGVVGGSMLVGGLMVAIDRLCLSRTRSVTSVALYAFMLTAALRVPQWSIFTALLTGGIGVAPIVVRFLERRGASGERTHAASASAPPAPAQVSAGAPGADWRSRPD